MTVKFIVHLLVLAAAHQLVAPDNDFYDDGNKIDELTIFQLLGLFRSSNGIVEYLPDGAFSASKEFNGDHAAFYARIGRDHVKGKSHAWCSGYSMGEEITVDLTTSYLVTGVATQGRGDHSGMVTSYSVETSEDGHRWIAQGRFRGNFDKTTICRRRFNKPVLASFVKFTVLDFKDMSCMRLDVLFHNIGDQL